MGPEAPWQETADVLHFATSHVLFLLAAKERHAAAFHRRLKDIPGCLGTGILER
jgi:hypothetical protein